MTTNPNPTTHERVALVTGGNRGLGLATARRLGREGVTVVIGARDETRARAAVVGLREAGVWASAVPLDVDDDASVKDAAERIRREHGRLDILVNNAGIWRGGPIAEARIADAQEMLAVHVLAVIAASRAALPHMPDGGRILSIGSCLAQRVSGPGMSLYAMSKSALIGLTKGMARDLGPRGITVNVVDPGPTDTDMNPADSERGQAQWALVPLGRYGRPQEVPLRAIVEHGIPVALGADDPLLFGSRLAAQYDVAREELDFSDEGLAELARGSLRASRAPEDVRKQALEGIDAWLVQGL